MHRIWLARARSCRRSGRDFGGNRCRRIGQVEAVQVPTWSYHTAPTALRHIHSPRACVKIFIPCIVVRRMPALHRVVQLPPGCRPFTPSRANGLTDLPYRQVGCPDRDVDLSNAVVESVWRKEAVAPTADRIRIGPGRSGSALPGATAVECAIAFGAQSSGTT